MHKEYIMKLSKVGIRDGIYAPLESLIELNKKKGVSREIIKRDYGQTGADIFDGKTNICLVNDPNYLKDDKFMNTLKVFLGIDKRKYNYESGDSLKKIMMKYLLNNETINDSQIQNRFGKKGFEVLEVFKVMGYVKNLGNICERNIKL